MSEPFFSSLASSMGDTIATSLKKLNRQLYLSFSGGGSMPNPFYASLDANMGDTAESSLKKINQLILLGAGGGGGGIGAVQSGNGAPEGVVTCVSGSCVYIQKDSSPPGVVWSYAGVAGGNTGWA